MNRLWLINANHKYAQIFVFEKNNTDNSVKEIAALYCPEARRLQRQSDAPGRSYDRKGRNRHQLEPHTDPKRYVTMQFAKDIADRLEQGRINAEFDALVIVAPADVIGCLRSQLSDQCRTMIKHECSKNMTQRKLSDIVGLFPLPLKIFMEQRLPKAARIIA